MSPTIILTLALTLTQVEFWPVPKAEWPKPVPVTVEVPVTVIVNTGHWPKELIGPNDWRWLRHDGFWWYYLPNETYVWYDKTQKKWVPWTGPVPWFDNKCQLKWDGTKWIKVCPNVTGQ